MNKAISFIETVLLCSAMLIINLKLTTVSNYQPFFRELHDTLPVNRLIKVLICLRLQSYLVAAISLLPVLMLRSLKLSFQEKA